MHTLELPGPWEIEVDAGVHHVNAVNGNWVCECMAEAAPLIAAAPEMIEALQQIRGFVAVMDASNWQDMRLHIERQCAILAKAEGT